MADEQVAGGVAPVPQGESKLGEAKPKLAKAKKVEKPVEIDPTTGQPKPKPVPIPRVSPHAGKFIYFNVANPVIGPNKANPKRPGTKCFDAFAMYVEGRSVEEQVEAWKTKTYTNKNGKVKPVGDMTDVNWDIGHGFIVLEGAKRQ